MVTGSQYTLNFVFSQGGSTAGSHQTVDVTGVRETAFFEVTTQTNKYQVRDVTAEYLPYLNVMLGDLNGDGKRTIADVTLLINYLLSHNASAIILESYACLGGNADLLEKMIKEMIGPARKEAKRLMSEVELPDNYNN